MEKTTVGYAARDLGISRQLVHVYIKKGLIRADKTGPERTAPYVLYVEDIAKLIGSDRLVAAHAQRMRLLGKPKKKKAASAASVSAEVPLESAATNFESAAGVSSEKISEAAGAATVEAAGTAGDR